MGSTKSRKKNKRLHKCSKDQVQSPELQAFRKHSSELHLALNSSVISSLVWELHQEGILSLSRVNDINHVTLMESTRSNMLLSSLEKSISTEFVHFYTVIQFFNTHLELKPIAERMRTTIIRIRNSLVPGFEDYSSYSKKKTKGMSCTNIRKRVLFAIAVILIIVLGVIFFLGVLLGSSPDSVPQFIAKPIMVIRGHFSQVPPSHQVGFDEHDFSNITFPLPSAPQPFVGRSDEMKQIISDTTNSTISIIGLFGPPAFGKTALAIHVGHHLKTRVIVNYIDLNEFSTFFERQLHTTSDHDFDRKNGEIQLYRQEYFPSVLSYKKTRTMNSALFISWAKAISEPTLLIMDNCDTVLNRWHDEFQEFVVELARSEQHLTILITSQVKISFLDHFTAYKISELSQEASYSLIAKLHPQVPEEVQVEIAKLVGNCPLAIKVVVTLLKQPESMSPTELVKQLQLNTLEVISTRELPKKDRFVAVMDIAWQQLKTKQRNAAFRLGLFPGSFDEEVLRHSYLTKQFKDLIEHSLVERYSHPLGVRYKLHKLIKDYFNHQLEKSGKEKEKLIDNFDAYFRVYYTQMFFGHMQSLNVTYLEMHPDSFYTTEQHNLNLLLSLLMPLVSKPLPPKSTAIVLFAYKQGLLDRKYLPDLFLLIKRILENDKTLDDVCALLNNSECSDIFTRFFISHLSSNGDTQHNASTPLSCLLLEHFRSYVEDPEKLKEIVSEPAQLGLIQSLVTSSSCFCKQRDFSLKMRMLMLVFCFLVFSGHHFKHYKQIYYLTTHDRNCSTIWYVSLVVVFFLKLMFCLFFDISSSDHLQSLLIIGIVLVCHCSTLFKAAALLCLVIGLCYIEQFISLKLFDYGDYIVLTFHLLLVTAFFMTVGKFYPFGRYKSLVFLVYLCIFYYIDIFQTTLFAVTRYIADGKLTEYVCHFILWANMPLLALCSVLILSFLLIFIPLQVAYKIPHFVLERTYNRLYAHEYIEQINE